MTLVFGVARTIEVTRQVAPEQWRRHLAVVLAGLRTDAAGPLPGRPVPLGALQGAVDQWAESLVGRIECSE
jgi:hypothetical protein